MPDRVLSWRRRYSTVRLRSVTEVVPTAATWTNSSGQLERAWARLPEVQTQVLGLVYGAGLTQAQVSHRLQLPLGQVKQLVARGLQNLGRPSDDERA